MKLRLSLALSTVKRTFVTGAGVVQTGDDQLLLTQSGDVIMTQNGDFLVRTRAPARQIVTQSGLFLVTQDDRILETR